MGVIEGERGVGVTEGRDRLEEDGQPEREGEREELGKGGLIEDGERGEGRERKRERGTGTRPAPKAVERTHERRGVPNR